MPRPRKVSEQRSLLDTKDHSIPIRIIVEYGRNNVRASVTKNALIIRLPYGMPPKSQQAQVEKMRQWALDTLAKTPDAFAAFRKIPMTEGPNRYQFTIRGETFAVVVRMHAKKRHYIRFTGEELLLDINPSDRDAHNGKLVGRLLAQHFTALHWSRVHERVHELNALHFQQAVGAVNLRNTVSQWGSCSANGNISLASRLILAPDPVLDAVIVHELAHFLVRDHSEAFWAEVYRAMPDYDEHDQWLRENGATLQFLPEPYAGDRP